ncbi:MAG: HAMP domain-containing sensor histidine kinase [Candidatus Obscuribacterales bacterium]|nr:HAMP domain-containing sensor histidine kinase [Candidatus Obscuribacterales bacterium]
MEDIKTISHRLVLSNIFVFIVVLGIFSSSVFYFWSSQIAEQERVEISRLTDSVIASIDFEKDKDIVPDLLATEMSESESHSLTSLRLQYFDANGKLLIERGNLKIEAPLHLENSLYVQSLPHALVQTKSASHEGKLLGYVRVATPLNDSDEMKQTLLTGLSLGLVVALSAAALGTVWLVKLSLFPIQQYIHRLEKFTADASHELRSPIAVVRTNSEVALKYRENTSKTDIEKFEVILDAAMQMQKLTEDLLTLARGQQKEALSECKTHSIVEVINEAVAPVLAMQNNSRVKVDIKLPEPGTIAESALQVTGKRDDITRIIRNIVENGVRYSKENGTVNIKVETQPEAVIVNIIDDGIGIAADDLPYLFERFWRADKARNHHMGGNGLGLSIASALAQENHGSIVVTSELNKGSTFTIKLSRTT